jgi:hypothetical protein
MKKPIRTDLLIFPCSDSKRGISSTGRTKSIDGYLSRKARRLLHQTRRKVFSRATTRLDRRSPLLPAIDTYTGNLYRHPRFKRAICELGRKGVHCLILSGGYGLLLPSEGIHVYNARMKDTAALWRKPHQDSC